MILCRSSAARLLASLSPRGISARGVCGICTVGESTREDVLAEALHAWPFDRRSSHHPKSETEACLLCTGELRYPAIRHEPSGNCSVRTGPIPLARKCLIGRELGHGCHLSALQCLSSGASSRSRATANAVVPSSEDAGISGPIGVVSAC